MNERATAIASLAADYKYFDETTRERGFVDLFNVTACEVCGTEVCGPNAGRFTVSEEELEAAGLSNRRQPREELGYSDLHEAATCPDCCYDPAAARPERSAQ